MAVDPPGDAPFEAACDDSTAFRAGWVIVLHFARSAATCEAAIGTAVRGVTRVLTEVGPPYRVTRVEAGDYYPIIPPCLRKTP